MSMRQTGGSMPYLQHGSLANPHSGGWAHGDRKEKPRIFHAGVDRIIFLLIALGFIGMETFVKPNSDYVTTVQPIEQRYVFASYEECATKLAQLKATNKDVEGLRCVPDGSSH